MATVTERIREVKQPRGGYIKPSQFQMREIDDGLMLNKDENVHASIIGMVVDYMTRFLMGEKVEDAFEIAYQGASIAEKGFNQRNSLNRAQAFLDTIKSLDESSIISACKMVTYDVWYRNPMAAIMAKGPDEIKPDADTIQNIIIMVERSIQFWDEYGPIVKDGFDFKPNGYTKMIHAGDGDYLTKDTLWDFKLSKKQPTSKHTLQILIYWIMGQHSGQNIYNGIQNIGIFNPRLNRVYRLDVASIPPETIEEIEEYIICY